MSPRTVPMLFREQEFIQTLTKIFHHVIALIFPMYQYIQADFFLKPDTFFNLFRINFYIITESACSDIKSQRRSPCSQQGCGQHPQIAVILQNRKITALQEIFASNQQINLFPLSILINTIALLNRSKSALW